MGLKERRRLKSSTHLRLTRPVLVNGLRLFWAIVIFWGDFGVYFWSLASCRWPDSSLAHSKKRPTHVMIISDPQVRQPSIFYEETSWLGSLRQLIFDLNLKKNWNVAAHFKPDVVIFLGDMLASGKHVRSEKEYKQYFNKFRLVFSLDSSIAVHYVPGNNDVGMGVSRALSKKVRQNYFMTFGPFNHQATIRGHQFLFLDAPGLVDEDYQRSAEGIPYDRWDPVPEGPLEFVKSVVIDPSPVVLFTHIPLARPDSASCGPLRERGSIRRGAGHGYQNTFGKQTTSFLLKTLQPVVVYSGDNRDYCDYKHKLPSPDREAEHKNDIPEITVKSFSMARHIEHPGFQLLSLSDPSVALSKNKPSYADASCTLPYQNGIYSHVYLPLILFSFIGLVVFNLTRRCRMKLHLPPISISAGTHPTSPSPSHTWVPTSPTGSLPSALRTPTSAAGPMFRTASHPDPQGTPLNSPLYYPQDREEEDPMFPVQYATRDTRLMHDEWSPEHSVATADYHASSEFESPSSSKPFSYHAPRWSWSRTFVLFGRRRRITVRLPTLSWGRFRGILALLVEGRNSDAFLSRRGVLLSTFVDALSITWPSLLFWTLVSWWTF
ncbi:hypothetical protein DFS33DRAFT_66866 [Desarmillaria ectypa]|nr:hypothetical protein DFS33DRAFT_66866 [Desarmillaria ectypa]